MAETPMEGAAPSAAGGADDRPRLDLAAAGVTSPIVQAGYAYWLGLAADRLPARSMVDPGKIPALLPHIVIMGVQRDPLDFRYRLIGGEVRRHLTEDLTGQLLSAVPYQKQPSRMWSNLSWIAETGRPLTNRTPYVGPLKDIRAMQDVQLPLAADGRTVDGILVFVDFISKLPGTLVRQTTD